MPQVFLTSREVKKMPPVCMRCGQRTGDRHQHTFNYQPWHLRLLGMMTRFHITYLVTLTVPICDGCKGHWWRPLFAALGGFGLAFLAVLSIILVSVLLGNSPLIFLVFLGGFAVFLFAILLTVGGVIFFTMNSVRITDMQEKRGITFAGVHENFVAAVEKKRPKGRREDDEDEDEDEEEEDERPVRKAPPKALPKPASGQARRPPAKPGKAPAPPPRRPARDDDEDDLPRPRGRRS
jgi:hypothetical protein